ncbi:MAG: hypothetical protein ACKVUT_10425 [Gaiella sp.]
MSPLQNRVAPDGELVATAQRGTLLGNRGGRFHDPVAKTLLGRRRHVSRAWIACELAFKGWHAEVWGLGYTHLFFLDEVTALAAGHRPCYECRRRDAVAFAAAVAAGSALSPPPRAGALDLLLHEERRRGAHPREWDSLPDGAMVRLDDGFAAVAGDRLLRWSFGGYEATGQRPGRGPAWVLTPPTVLLALGNGYRPRWHPSASSA